MAAAIIRAKDREGERALIEYNLHVQLEQKKRKQTTEKVFKIFKSQVEVMIMIALCII